MLQPATIQAVDSEVYQRDPRRTFIAFFINEKYKHSKSEKTKEVYSMLYDYQDFLREHNLDIDSPKQKLYVASIAWCEHSKRIDAPTGLPKEIAPATFNLRKNVLRTFYKFAVKCEVRENNPALDIDPKVDPRRNRARAMPMSRIAEALDDIDTDMLIGKRDMAMITLALVTGSRGGAIVSLEARHIEILEGRLIYVKWSRLKGGHEDEGDLLDPLPSQIILDYLDAYFGSRQAFLRLQREEPMSPIWKSFNPNPKYRGGPIDLQDFQRRCKKILGNGKSHFMRKNCAVAMHLKGASVGEVARQLRHKNIATTSRYLEEESQSGNAYAGVLLEVFGIARKYKEA